MRQHLAGERRGVTNDDPMRSATETRHATIAIGLETRPPSVWRPGRFRSVERPIHQAHPPNGISAFEATSSPRPAAACWSVAEGERDISSRQTIG